MHAKFQFKKPDQKGIKHRPHKTGRPVYFLTGQTEVIFCNIYTENMVNI